MLKKDIDEVLRLHKLWLEDKPDGKRAYLQGAYLQGAYLRGAYLQGAYLQGAYLQGAYLQGAYLQGAYLRGAYLRGADLRGADLQGAYLALYSHDLYCLKLQPPKTKLRFWKYLKDGKSPCSTNGVIKYDVGKTYEEKKYNTNEKQECSSGLSVATLQWCLKDNAEADEFIEVEFCVSDIVAVPVFTDGKFRVKKLKVIRRINRKEAIKEMTDKFTF